jgi:8-oxo-dGTP diphosphatase
MSEPLQYFVACAVIFNNDGRILLTKRNNPNNSEVHNKWQLPGGSVDNAEHPLKAAIREVKEETGLTIKILSERPFIFSHTFIDEVHVILIVYKAKYISGKVDISQDLDETLDAKWFLPSEIPELQTLPETNEIIKATTTSND